MTEITAKLTDQYAALRWKKPSRFYVQRLHAYETSVSLGGSGRVTDNMVKWGFDAPNE